MIKLALSTRVALLALAPLAALTADPALARGFGEESALPLIDEVVRWIGYRDVNADWRDLFAFSLFSYAVAFGYGTDLVLQDRGFGKILNGLVGVIGICIALRFFGEGPSQLRGAASETMRFQLTLIVAGAGSALSLFVSALTKGIVTRFTQRHLDRLDKPAPPRKMIVDAPLDPRIASALRDKP